MKEIRLDRFLSENGKGTRSEVKTVIRKGRVTVNGRTEKRPEQKTDPDKDIIELDGERVEPRPEFVYYLLNKPAGCVSAVTDAKDRTVLELVPDDRKDLFPVGRLDKDTEGLLLITNDGALAHELLAPGKHVDKTYYVVTERPVTAAEAEMLAEGVMIGDDRPTREADVQLLEPEDGKGRMLLTIREGRYHQVKRMAEAVGTRVVYLKRIRMGELYLPDDLSPGQCMKVPDQVVQLLKQRL